MSKSKKAMWYFRFFKSKNICLNLNDECPINDIKIDNNNNNNNSEIIFIKTIKLNNGKFLHYCIGQYNWKYYYELEPIIY